MSALRRVGTFLLAFLLTASLVMPVVATLAVPTPFSLPLPAGPLVAFVALPAALWLTARGTEPARLWETLVVFVVVGLLAALFAATVLTSLGVTGGVRDVAIFAVVYGLTYHLGWRRRWRRWW